jgi:hypothetical protein
MRIQEHTFENQEVVLDFHEFDHCVFTKCKMKVFGYGPFTLANSEITDCRWEFAGPAASTIQVMTMLYHGGAKDLIEATIANIRKGPKG